jgi:DNA-binding GntR family transcriptional regulator
LEREGLATPTIQGGYTVASLTRKEIEDIFGIRSILESYAGRIATISYQDGDLRELEEKHEEAQRKLRNSKLEDLARINTEFHDVLYSLSRRPKLIEMINNLQDQTYRFRRMILREAKNAQVSISTHGVLLVALRKRDADRVETLIRKHILRGQRIILKSLEKKEEKF